MNFFIIHVPESKASISHAERAYKSVRNFYDNVEIYNGYDPKRAQKFLKEKSISHDDEMLKNLQIVRFEWSQNFRKNF